jgi:IS30 family transposase
MAVVAATERARPSSAPGIRRGVRGKLRLQRSPYQVAGWLNHAYPQDETNQVSHATICRTLFIQARGALKKEFVLTKNGSLPLPSDDSWRDGVPATRKRAGHAYFLSRIGDASRP